LQPNTEQKQLFQLFLQQQAQNQSSTKTPMIKRAVKKPWLPKGTGRKLPYQRRPTGVASVQEESVHDLEDILQYLTDQDILDQYCVKEECMYVCL